MNDVTSQSTGSAFIIQPFRVHQYHAGEKLDFDKVDRKLMTPVLTQLGFIVETTTAYPCDGTVSYKYANYGNEGGL